MVFAYAVKVLQSVENLNELKVNIAGVKLIVLEILFQFIVIFV